MQQDVTAPVRLELQPDPNALAVLQQRYGHLTPDGTFVPAPHVLDAAQAQQRVQSHGTDWQLMQITAHARAHGTTGEATLAGIEDDRPLHCLYSQTQAILAAQSDAEDWARLGL